MAVGLTFFENIFLNRELKEKKIKKYEEQHGAIEKYEVFDSTEFIKDYDTTDINTDDVIRETDYNDDSISAGISNVLDESTTENKDGIILLEKTSDGVLYEEDDEANFDDKGNTKVYINNLSKTLKFKSNINFDDDIVDKKDKNFEDDKKEISSELDADEIMNRFDKKLDSVLNSDNLESAMETSSEEVAQKKIDSVEIMSIIDKRLESLSELEEYSSSSELVNESADFDLSNGIMHFDLDDQLDITDLEGGNSSLINSAFEEIEIDSEEIHLGLHDDFEDTNTITSIKEENSTNFPVLDSLNRPVTEEQTIINDDDEINIPLL